MADRPILFSGPMVRALLEGRKTQTRRVLKPRADKNFGPRCVLQPHEIAGEVKVGRYQNCPYGQPGDLLWVRETWMDLRGTGIEHRPTPDSPIQRYAYGADSPRGSHSDEVRKDYGLKWRPSIFMPRRASRLTLRITEVRVQRLQDISEADAVAEGVERDSDGWIDYLMPGTQRCTNARDSFRTLWESINGPGSWDANPWVWALTFEVIKANVDSQEGRRDEIANRAL